MSQANPFVEDGFHYLDKAMAWGAKYGIGVLLDLHAAPGSQVWRRLPIKYLKDLCNSGC